MIEVRSLVKTFGFRDSTVAVDDVSFSVKKGTIFCLLGPKNAGKTTILRILATTLRQTSGTVEIEGHDSLAETRKVRELIGFMPETTDFHPWSRGSDYLEFWGKVLGMPKTQRRNRASELLAFFEIGDAASEDPNGYSVGLQKRISLAQALLSDPPVLLLDEPMTGLALPERSSLAEKLQYLQTKGKTIFLSSVSLRDVQLVCDVVAVILGGHATPAYEKATLLRRIGEGGNARIFVDLEGPSEAVSSLGELDGVIDVKSQMAVTIIYVDPGRIGTEEIAEALRTKGVKVKAVREAEITLGDVFRALYTENAS